MPTSDELRAALAVAELEDELVAAKDSDIDPEDLRALKHRVRSARQVYRENHRSPAVGGTAEPAPVTATAAVKEN